MNMKKSELAHKVIEILGKGSECPFEHHHIRYLINYCIIHKLTLSKEHIDQLLGAALDCCDNDPSCTMYYYQYDMAGYTIYYKLTEVFK